MSLYSDLNEVLTPYAQKIKEKADKSTTYTKNEVDDLISEVDVETDTTLDVPGAPADAAETGRQIGLLKADLADKSDTADMLKAFPTDTASGAVASFTDGANGIPVKSLVVGIEPAQAGSGDPSPTNVRPISGWAGVNVTRCRKNLLPPCSESVITSQGVTFTNDNGKYIVNGTSIARATCGIDVHLPPGEYTFAGFNQLGAPMGVYIMANNTVLHNISLNTDNTVNTFTLTQSADMVRFTVARDITIENGTANLEIVKGAVAPTEWEPYSVNTYSITFPTEAGTVYGGTLDVTTGVLTVDMAIVDMGTLNWLYYSSQQRIVARVNSGKPAGDNTGLDGVCSVYKVVNTAYRLAPDKSVVIGNNLISNSYAAMVVHDEDYADAETFKAAVSGQTLVFPIKTPVTYQLTPTEVTTLLGTNNIWADTGDCAVEYRADTKLYIDRVYVDYRTMLAPVESTYTATRNYTTGQLLIVGNTLYKVTANIANGGTIAPNTNVTATTLSGVISALA